MATDATVLVVCKQSKVAESVAYSLRQHGMQVVVAASPDAVLKHLANKPCDLLIAQDDLGTTTGIDLLIQVRQQYPITRRCLIANKINGKSTIEIVNDAGPCFVFTEKPDPDRVWQLLALEGPVGHTGADPKLAQMKLETEKMERRNRQLEEENQLLTQEMENIQRRHQQARKSPHQETAGTGRSQDGASSGAGAIDPAAMTKRIAMLTRLMDQMMENEEVVLPVFPPIGLEVQRVLDDETAEYESLVERIEQEQSLSARLLQVANSPLYAGLERTRNLNQAISRLGLRETRNILLAVITENLFKTKSRNLAKLMARLWVHSLCCAYSNENIAHTLHMPQSEDYFVMGLLHDIGKLVVLQLVEQAAQEDEIAREDLTEQLIMGLMDAYHHDFGARLLEKWQYSKPFVDVVGHHNDKHIQTMTEPVIVTHFSNLLTRKIGYSLLPHDEKEFHNKQLAEALNMTPGTRLLLEKGLQQKVEQIRTAYMGG